LNIACSSDGSSLTVTAYTALNCSGTTDPSNSFTTQGACQAGTLDKNAAGEQWKCIPVASVPQAFPAANITTTLAFFSQDGCGWDSVQTVYGVDANDCNDEIDAGGGGGGGGHRGGGGVDFYHPISISIQSCDDGGNVAYTIFEGTGCSGTGTTGTAVTGSCQSQSVGRFTRYMQIWCQTPTQVKQMLASQKQF